MPKATSRTMESELRELKVILDSISEQSLRTLEGEATNVPPADEASTSLTAAKDTRSPGVPTKKEKKATRRERVAATYRRRKKNKNNEKENEVTPARRSPRSQPLNKDLIASLREVVNRLVDMI